MDFQIVNKSQFRHLLAQLFTLDHSSVFIVVIASILHLARATIPSQRTIHTIHHDLNASVATYECIVHSIYLLIVENCVKFSNVAWKFPEFNLFNTLRSFDKRNMACTKGSSPVCVIFS